MRMNSDYFPKEHLPADFNKGEVLWVVKATDFWDVVPCSLIEV
jgi:hypothetical protein